MSPRILMAEIVLALLTLLQLAALTVPVALLLLAPDGPPIRDLLALLLQGRAHIALAVAVMAAIGPGALSALALWRMEFRCVATAALIAPLLLPSALFVQGMGPQSQILLLIGFASQGAALGLICGCLSLYRLDLGVLRAAACCGVSPMAAYRRVLLVQLGPGMLAGAILAGISAAATCLGLLSRMLPGGAVLRHVVQPTPWLQALGVTLALCLLVWSALALLRRR